MDELIDNNPKENQKQLEKEVSQLREDFKYSNISNPRVKASLNCHCMKKTCWKFHPNGQEIKPVFLRGMTKPDWDKWSRAQMLKRYGFSRHQFVLKKQKTSSKAAEVHRSQGRNQTFYQTGTEGPG